MCLAALLFASISDCIWVFLPRCVDYVVCGTALCPFIILLNSFCSLALHTDKLVVKLLLKVEGEQAGRFLLHKTFCLFNDMFILDCSV